ncbi:putative alkaline phosphatase family protein [Erysiphe necator]|uniref:Putative alkaline phosphatase family protein n=1 Tax=Uncinula necator TaxID=52586 RepID=A0A0B1PBU6_UNCNE|nr:putative alkaline phosphatase family protein [Erysiphe necator]
MSSLYEVVTVVSSIVLRLSAYIFLRWIPSHQFPMVIYTSFALYTPTFLILFYQAQKTQHATTKGCSQTEFPTVKGYTKNSVLEIKLEQKIITKRSHKIWPTLLLGLPSPKSILISLISFTTNLVLVLGVLDLVYHARLLYPVENLSFARLGYISPTEAKLIVREPNTSKLPVYVYYRLLNSTTDREDAPWKDVDIIKSTGNQTDYTATVTIKLPNTPEQTYQWKTSTNHTGVFTTPPYPGKFTSDGDFTFLTSSCIKARFPYNPLTHALQIPGFKHLAQGLKYFPRAQFMLFLGDFIYIDVPKRFGITAEDYRREYRQVYASPDWPLVGQNLSWIHVLDDHEIANDWDRRTTGLYRSAVDPWHHYQTVANPPSPKHILSPNNLTYYEFTQGPASFFMLDTRSYRDSSRDIPAKAKGKTMLGSSQLSAFLDFLRKPEAEGVKWKFVISSIPFTKNWRVNAQDTWAGYLNERKIILEAMWDASHQNNVKIVVLSGDRHEFAATAFPPPDGGKWPLSSTVYEYSVGPLSQFYLPIPTYMQFDNEDVKVKYIPAGNSKFGVITIKKAKSSNHSTLNFQLYVDGLETWSNTLSSPPFLSKV